MIKYEYLGHRRVKEKRNCPIFNKGESTACPREGPTVTKKSNKASRVTPVGEERNKKPAKIDSPSQKQYFNSRELKGKTARIEVRRGWEKAPSWGKTTWAQMKVPGSSRVSGGWFEQKTNLGEKGFGPRGPHTWPDQLLGDESKKGN